MVNIRKNLTVRNQFVQVAADHPRACLIGMGWKPALSNQAISSGSRHFVMGDSLVRDLNEIFVNGQTTVLSFGGASVAQLIKMMKFQGEDHLDTLVIILGTSDVSRAPVTPEGKWEPLMLCLLNELKEKYRPRLVVPCTITQNPEVGTPVADFMNGNVEFRRPPLLAQSTPGPVVDRNHPPPHFRRFCLEYLFHSPHKQDPLSNSLPLACPLGCTSPLMRHCAV